MMDQSSPAAHGQRDDGQTRRPAGPFNPAFPVEVTPSDYERQVVAWLRDSCRDLENLSVTHLAERQGPGGEYQFDSVVEFSFARGARIVVLVECKRVGRAIERDEVLSLYAKVPEVGANKAMLFSTCGFQRGALLYASSKGIATVTFAQGGFLYETRSLDSHAPPPWVRVPRYMGVMMTATDEASLSMRAFEDGRLEVLATWVRNPLELA